MTQNDRKANRLINETSPYLLQHAHNPVDWYAWGVEAFEKARSDDKPVLVSIGYSACHWCHVMEHESFEDEKTAEIMNRHFVNIKVDMEERPDVDQIYMNFVQLTTGRGGWPMNVFLTPDKRPFFGGTYFPPVPRYNMPSWQQILISIAEAFEKRRDELETSANEIVGELRRLTLAEPGKGDLSPDLLENAFSALTRNFDRTNGGFGGAPKFPPSMTLEFLLRYHYRTGDEHALEIVRRTCDKMAAGGIYDQLGGGFHRYSVDAVWLVPHFEKMLYDNAQLIRIYLHLFQVTRDESYKRVAVETLEYVRREMLDASGAFYSTQDADSEGEEGKFFVWTPGEIEAVLGEEEARIFNAFFDVSPDGNFEGNNILNVKRSTVEVASSLGVSVEAVDKTVHNGRKALFDAREGRVKPYRDEKVLTAWNGLMLAAFADAAAVLGNGEYLEIARRNAQFLTGEMRKGSRLLRTWKAGVAKLSAYVEDYANVADGSLCLYEATGDGRHLDEAISLAEVMIEEFWDADNGGFFFTSSDHEELIVRNKDFYDNATPSGNSVAADLLLRLSRLTGREELERYAVSILRIAASQIKRFPQGFGRALSALEYYFSEPREIAVFGAEGNELERTVLEAYLPDAVIALVHDAGSDADLPITDGRSQAGGEPTAYVCRSFVCERPVSSVVELDQLLAGN